MISANNNRPGTPVSSANRRKAGTLLKAVRITLVCFLIVVSGAVTVLAGSGQVIVQDQAGLLTDSQVTSITDSANALADRTGWDVFLLSTDDAGGKEAEEVAEDFYMAHFHQDDGFCALIDMDNREIYLATSGDVIYYVTDERKEDILDDAFDAISNGDYAGTYRAMINGVAGAYNEGVDSSHYLYNEDTGRIEYYEPPKAVTPAEGLASALLGLLGALGLSGTVSAGYKKKGKAHRYNMAANTKIKLTGKSDVLVNKFTTRRRIPRNPPPSAGGGGRSGGHRSTVHTGSGGHTFGGGGRKF